MTGQKFRNPKPHIHNRPVWYDYYAHFSEDFVEDVLTYINVNKATKVLDPWNGSGTTTLVAEDNGYCALGYDINPAMVIVARARRLDPDSSINLPSLCNDIIKKAKKFQDSPVLDADPLCIWLSTGSVSEIRKLESAIQLLLLGRDHFLVSRLKSLDTLNSLVSVFYTCLFQTVREILAPFKSSNPTWIKEPDSTHQVIDVHPEKIFSVFEGHTLNTVKMLETRRYKRVHSHFADVVIDLASSTSIPVQDEQVALVISSPPYCTRIDYAVATKPELAVLGYNLPEIAQLRDRTIGTTTIFDKSILPSELWGEICNSFLLSVYNHDSKASKTYYYRNFLQYFDSIYRSFQEINRVLSSDGYCVLVVQDSYYKDVHNDLPRIVSDFGASLKWNLSSRYDYPIDRTLAAVNRRTKQYRSASNALESVLIFEKS